MIVEKILSTTAFFTRKNVPACFLLSKCIDDGGTKAMFFFVEMFVLFFFLEMLFYEIFESFESFVSVEFKDFWILI